MNSQEPILNDFPDHFETERLLVRCPRPGDGSALYGAVEASQPELNRWMPWSYNYTLNAAEVFVRGAQAEFLRRENLPLSIFRKTDGLYLGGTGLHDIVWNVPRFEIGYWLRTDCTGEGYMTEAVIALTDFCRAHFQARRMTIRCDSLNERSRRVAERAGYTLESITHHDRRGLDDNTLRDTLTFAKT